MKNIAIFCLLISLLFSNRILAQDPPQLKEGFIMTRNFQDPYIEESKNWVSRSSSIVTYHSYDALHYKLELDFYSNYSVPYNHSYKAIETFTFKVDSVLSSIQLNAIDSSITVDSVNLSGISFQQKNDTLTVNLDSTYQVSDTVTIKIFYRHNNVLDKTFLARDGFVFTDCSPEKARNWFPCWDKPFDKATCEVIVRTNKEAELCSNGSLIDSATVNDTLIYHWKSRDPMSTYIMANLSNMNYSVSEMYWKKPSNSSDSIPVQFYYNKGEKIDSLKNQMIDMANYFSSLFGEYPFEKIAWATLNSDFPWAGMENQTIISLYYNGWADKNVVSHEFAHHWFGDLITHATWADIFLKEGFPQYSVCLWFEHLLGSKAYLSKTQEFSDYYLKNNPGRPIYNPSWANSTPPSSTLFDYAVTYCKSACVLHMLRNVVGDSTFFKIIKSYATDSAFMFKTATVRDFYNKVNSISGKDYSWFLDEWLNNSNHPVYTNTYKIAVNGTAWKIDFTTKQTQTNAPFFKMPVDLEITFRDNSDTIISFLNDINNQKITLNFSKEPKTVVFDPFSKILPKVETTVSGCTGIITITAVSDTIEDGSGANNYGNNANCFWFISPLNNPSSINLHFIDFDTEDSNDVLSIWDWSVVPSVQLASYTGRNIPTDLLCNTNKVRFKFSSNSSITRQGWIIYYTTLTDIKDDAGNIKLFSAYPNPAKNSLNIKVVLGSPDKTTLSLRNFLGQTVYLETLESASTIEKSINVSNLAKGIYLIEIKCNYGKMQKKIVIE